MELPEIDFRFTRSGMIVTVIILLIGLFLQIIPLDFFGLFSKPADYLFPVISILLSAGIIILWFIIGDRYGPRIGNLLVENKIVALIFVKGDKYYFEKVSEEAHDVKGPQVLARFINLLIAWISISSSLVSIFGNFIMKIIYDANPVTDPLLADPVIRFLSSTALLEILLKFLLIIIIAPLILTLIVPISWLLLDVHLKALQSSSMTNWYVGKKVQARLNSFVSIGALVALGGSFGIENLANKLITIVSLVFYCLFYVSFPIILIVILYSLFFHTTFYESFLEAIPIPYGETKVEFFVKEGKYSGKKVEIADKEEKTPEISEEEKKEQETDDNAIVSEKTGDST
ncbi:MAG: hypothetical protein ACTSRU_05660 [Candidatus Hodarchaeales archaeon]